jgi:Predicted membrane protein (DUF2207)
MVGMLAIVAAAAWLLVFFVCALVTRIPPLATGAAAPWPGLAGERPALVNLVVTRCQPTGAAYSATILDLAARGHLAITQRMAGQLWCDVPAAAPPDTGPAPSERLAQSERLVLAAARRLAGGAGAPFEAVAERCASDVRATWDPFERAVRAEGRQAGVTRARLPVAVQIPLYAGAAIIGALVFATTDAMPHADGVWTPLVAAVIALIIPLTMVGGLSQKDRLTGHGSVLGAWAVREAADAAAGWRHAGPVPASSPAELSALARVVAAGVPVPVPGASPGLAAGVRPGRGRARTGSSDSAGTPRPAVAWSSWGGQWRLVRIDPVFTGRWHPAAWLPFVIWLAGLAFAASLLPSPSGELLPLLPAAGAAAAAIAAVRGLSVRLATPAEASFRGQVIARWMETRGNGDSDWEAPCIAVDDGERSWSFEVKDPASRQLALGDRVAVRAAPRAGKLLSLELEPGDRDRGAAAPARAARDLMADTDFIRATPGPPGPLPTAEEVGAAVGRPVQATGFQIGFTGASYRGEGLTVSITVAKGGWGGLSSGAARRWGRALPGIGDEAWLLSRDRTVVFLVGDYTGKVSISGAAAGALPPDVLLRLATIIVGRLTGPDDRLTGPDNGLTGPDDRQPGGTPSPGTWS